MDSKFLPAGTSKLVSGIVPIGWDSPVQRSIGGLQQTITPALLGGLAFKTNIGALTSILTGNLKLGALASLGSGALSSLSNLAGFNPSQLGSLLPAIPNIPNVAQNALGMATQFGGSIAGLNPTQLLQGQTALTGLTSLSTMNIGVTPMLNSMNQMTALTSVLSNGIASLGGADKVLGTSGVAFNNAISSFNNTAVVTGSSLNSALLGRPQLLDSNTQNALGMAVDVGIITGVIKQNSGAFYKTSAGTELINKIGAAARLGSAIGIFGENASGLANANYSTPGNLVNSLAGALSGAKSPLAGSGSLLGSIGGMAQPAAPVSAEALIACGYGNWEVYDSYKRQPSAMSDPAFWAGRRPMQNGSKKGIYNLGDYMGSQEAQNEVYMRNKRNNYNVMIQRGLLDDTFDPQMINSFLQVAHFNLTDAFGIKGGGVSGANAYGMNLSSIFAASMPQVSNILSSVVKGAAIVNNLLNNAKGFPGVSNLMGGASAGVNLGFIVGNLLQSPHLLNSQAFNYLNKSDVNKLARGTNFYQQTPASNYDSTRSISVPLPGKEGKSFSMPESGFNSGYPHNVTRQTPSGMVEEFDGTPDSTRYHLYHPSGTRVEIDNAGVMVKRVNSDDYVEITGDNFIHVKGSYNLVVNGPLNLMAKDKVQLLAEGEVDAEFRNDVNFTVSGSMNVIAKEAFRVKAREIQMEATDMSFKADYSLTDESKRRSTKIGEGGYDVTGEGVAITTKALSVVAEKDISLFANGSFSAAAAEGEMKLGGKQQVTIVTPESIILRASKDTKVIADRNLYLSSGTNTYDYWGSTRIVVTNPSVPGATRQTQGTVNFEATRAKNDEVKPISQVNPKVFIDIDKIEKRANPSNPPAATPYSKSNSFRESLHSESEGGSSKGNSASVGAPNTSGGSSSSGTVTPTPSKDLPTSANTSPGVPVDASEFSTILRGDEIGDKLYSMRLSPNLLVKNLSRDLGHTIEAQSGLSAAQILTNMKTTAENVVEPLLKKYSGNLIITSGFRNARNVKSKTSQHCKGQAVDLQRKDLNRNSRADYEKFRNEIISTVSGYDQIILEQATSGAFWIHVSYNSAGNRRSSFNINGASGSA